MPCSFHKTLSTQRDPRTGAPTKVECLTCRTVWTVVKGSASLDEFFPQEGST